MRANLAAALAFILEDEGPELNISAGEPGGASRYGVSVTALSDWNKRHGRPPASIADVKNMTAEFASQIYGTDYLNPIRFDDLPVGVDYRLADVTVNLGVTGGIKLLQGVVGMPVTGHISDGEVLAAGAIDPRDLIQKIADAWLAQKRKSLSWPRYGKGWTNRFNRATGRALAMRS